MRLLFFIAGCVSFAIGFVGAFVPLLPTVPFMLLALLCFARSSKRLHTWLYTHPRFGPPLRDWDQHRIIPRRAKILAISMMSLSFVIVLFTTSLALVGYLGIAACLVAVAAWMWVQAETPPSQKESGASD